MKQYKDKGEDPKKIGIMVASHNEDTVRFAIEKLVKTSSNIFINFIFRNIVIHILIVFFRMKEMGISPEDKVICFGQLLGMCDYLTFPLGK